MDTSRHSNLVGDAVRLAQDEANALGFDGVNTGCLLLGLSYFGGARKALQRAHVTYASARSSLTGLSSGRFERTFDEGMTHRAAQAFERAYELVPPGAKIHTDHLLRALIEDKEGVAGRMLERLEIDIAALDGYAVACDRERNTKHPV